MKPMLVLLSSMPAADGIPVGSGHNEDRSHARQLLATLFF